MINTKFLKPSDTSFKNNVVKNVNQYRNLMKKQQFKPSNSQINSIVMRMRKQSNSKLTPMPLHTHKSAHKAHAIIASKKGKNTMINKQTNKQTTVRKYNRRAVPVTNRTVTINKNTNSNTNANTNSNKNSNTNNKTKWGNMTNNNNRKTNVSIIKKRI
tara:strand:- start:876 stop:1349 length:474 start_codon:yes stop_codon:yes gene_type:complete